MHHYGVLLLHLATLFGLSEIGPNIQALNPKKEPAYKTLQFNTEWYNPDPNPENNDVKYHRLKNNGIASDIDLQIVKSEEFIWKKSIYRAESYGKAAMAGVKDNRSEQKVGVNLGFSQEIPKLEENLSGHETTKKLVCYYNVPSVYDAPYPVFPEQIDPFMCTHILLAFGRVVNFTLVPSDPRDIEFYTRTTALKAKNPTLKVMLSVASFNDGSTSGQEFVNMMVSQETRSRFINQSMEFLKTYGFDGIDVDWEFPAFNGPMQQKGQLTNLLKEIKEYQNKSNDFIVSAAVPAPKHIIDIGYDIKGIAASVDFINLMSYDYHYYSTFTPVTGPNSPLYNMSDEIGFFRTLNLAWSAKYWYQNGMPANKIIVGIPLYGHSYTLIDDRYHNYYSLTGGYGALGQNGFVPYVEICRFIEGGAQVVFNNETMEPYAYRVKEWVSYDNQRSVQAKAQFIKTMNFGGAMFYSLNLDDAWEVCKTSKTTFPLIGTVKRELEAESLEL